MMIILRNLVLLYFNHSCHVTNENVRLLEFVSLGHDRPRFAIEVVYSREDCLCVGSFGVSEYLCIFWGHIVLFVNIS